MYKLTVMIKNQTVDHSTMLNSWKTNRTLINMRIIATLSDLGSTFPVRVCRVQQTLTALCKNEATAFTNLGMS